MLRQAPRGFKKRENKPFHQPESLEERGLSRESARLRLKVAAPRKAVEIKTPNNGRNRAAVVRKGAPEPMTVPIEPLASGRSKAEAGWKRMEACVSA